MIGRSAGEHESSIAIAAFNHAAFVDFKPDAGMAERGTTRDIACAVTRDPARGDRDGFRMINHGWPLSNGSQMAQSDGLDHR